MENKLKKAVVMKVVFTALFLSAFPSISPGLESEPWRFIVTADSRSDSASDHNGVNVTILSEIAAEVIEHEPEFFLFAGDLAIGDPNQTIQEEQFMTWRDTMQPVYDANISVYIVRGNHDAVSYPSCIDAWNNVFKDESDPLLGGTDYSLPKNGPPGEVNLTYSVTHKNVFVLALDELKTQHRSKNYVNQTWINAQLAANEQPHIFAFGHFTAFKMMWDSLGNHPTERDSFWSSLENAGGRTYFCGHEHFYNRTRADDDDNPDNDLHQYVIGSAGASAHNWNGTFPGDNSGMTLTTIYHTIHFGYVIVDIDGLDVTLTWMERNTNDLQVAGTYHAKDIWSYTATCGDKAHPYPTGDFNKNCHVNYFDFTTIAAQWLKPIVNPSADIAPDDRDGKVNMLDLAAFAENWLQCTTTECQ